jgi:urease accessory protein
VLVHPPGGLVGGDVLDIGVQVGAGAHALVTTPGAARFYRSNGQPARQRTQLRLAENARLEWLPLEAIAYADCDAHNDLTFSLAPGAQLLAWDVTALGLPAAGQPFEHGAGQGAFTQHIEWPGHFLERGTLRADDALLLDGPLGLAGRRCLASLFLASGTALMRAQREALLEGTQALLQSASPGAAEGLVAGVTAPNEHLLVLRVLAPVVEPAMAVCKAVWAHWRTQLWGLPASAPRIWAM